MERVFNDLEGAIPLLSKLKQELLLHLETH